MYDWSSRVANKPRLSVRVYAINYTYPIVTLKFNSDCSLESISVTDCPSWSWDIQQTIEKEDAVMSSPTL